MRRVRHGIVRALKVAILLPGGHRAEPRQSTPAGAGYNRDMRHIEVALHRISVGGSIRVVVNGGRPTYLSEQEVRDRLSRQPRLDAERLDDIVRSLNTGGGEHTLRYGNPNSEYGDDLRTLWAGSDRPAEIE